MTLFSGRARKNLVHWLRRGDVRLLLPADPGPERMLECVRQFSPYARPASRGSINADGMNEIYLSRAFPVDPDMAAEAGIPGGLGAAFFVSKTTRARPYDWSDIHRKNTEQADASFRLVNGLAVRLGGIPHPEAPVLDEPLEARVYTGRTVDPADVRDAVARYAPGLAPHHHVTLASMGVSAWRTPDGGIQAEVWPAGKAVLMPRGLPLALDEMEPLPSELSAVRLEVSTPAGKADPAAARLLGECALGLAAGLDGVCADQLGFAVTRPEDFVFG